jgi:hypothetical protein
MQSTILTKILIMKFLKLSTFIKISAPSSFKLTMVSTLPPINLPNLKKKQKNSLKSL